MNRLSNRALGTWMLRLSVVPVLLLIGLVVTLIIEVEGMIVLSIILGALLAFSIIILIAWPLLKLKCHGYMYDDDKITISFGVVFRHVVVIPYLQIQDIGYVQGPFQMLFKVKSIHISTAGSNQYLDCIDSELATKMLDDINPKIQKKLKGGEDDEALL